MLYPVAFSIHMLGLITLFAAMALMHMVGARLRASSTWEDARTFLSLMVPALPMFGLGTLLLILSGLYMAHARWSFHAPWFVVALVTVVVLAGVGPAVAGKRLKSWLADAVANHGPLPDAVRGQFNDAGLWSTIYALNFAGLGIIWLMAAKPGWAGSLAVVLAMTAIGFGIGSAATRRRPS